MIARKVNIQNQDEIAQSLTEANQVALQALQKEVKLEKILEQEEKEREKQTEEELLKALECEKNKKENLNKAIKERQIEDQYNLKIQTAEAQIDKIRQITQNQVLIRRNELKNKMLKMRQQAQRNQKSIIAKLKEVKLSIAQDMTAVYKMGDSQKCKERSILVIKDYCTMNFPDSYLKFDDCKDLDNFCYICCENEFGDLRMENRQKCIEESCVPLNSDKATENNIGGVMQLVENINN